MLIPLLIFLGTYTVLAMSSTLAGNLTVLGSIANLIVVEGAARTACGSRSPSI